MTTNGKPPWETGEPGVPAVPGHEGTCPPHPDWTDAEKWAWGEIRAGRPADFRKQFGYLDPHDEYIWYTDEVEGQRLLRPEFLRAILLNHPWRGALPPSLVVIFGAYFVESIFLQGAELPFGINFSECKFDGKVVLTGAIVPRNFELHDCSVADSVNIDLIKIGGSLLIENCKLNEIFAGGSSVGKQISFKLSTVENRVILDGVQLKGGLLLTGLAVQKETSMLHADLGDGLNISDSKLQFLDLRRARVSTVYDKGGVWPPKLFLDGFQYETIDSIKGDPNPAALAKRPPSWFKNLLSRQKDFSPQPYEQCAKVLRAAGAPDKANAVLYECKERERRRASVLRWALKTKKGYKLTGGFVDFWRGVLLDAIWTFLKPVAWALRKIGFEPVKPSDPKLGRWLGLLFMKWTIGYGIGWRYTWSIGWAALLVVIGVWLCGVCEAGAGMDFSQKLAFSLDMFLPIIELSKGHGDKLAKITNPYTLWWFYFMKISGYGLAGLIIARLAGVGKRTT